MMVSVSTIPSVVMSSMRQNFTLFEALNIILFQDTEVVLYIVYHHPFGHRWVLILNVLFNFTNFICLSIETSIQMLLPKRGMSRPPFWIINLQFQVFGTQFHVSSPMFTLFCRPDLFNTRVYIGTIRFGPPVGAIQPRLMSYDHRNASSISVNCHFHLQRRFVSTGHCPVGAFAGECTKNCDMCGKCHANQELSNLWIVPVVDFSTSEMWWKALDEIMVSDRDCDYVFID